MKRSFFLACCLLSGSMVHIAKAQCYQALNGSAFTGSTARFNNPASTIHSAYKWDLTLLSTQFKLSNNSGYLKDTANALELTLKEGTHSNFMHTNVDVSLLNFLYKIDNNQAVSFGLRARSYTHVKTMPFVFDGTVKDLNSFFLANQNTPYLQGFATQTGWLEADLNYAKVLFEKEDSKLSAGVTLQVMKGLSGAYVKLNKLSYRTTKTASGTDFSFSGGSASMAYSANFDESSFKDVYKTAVGAFGLSAGVEYMHFSPEDNPGGNNNINYDWKIGVSLMDLGANTFKPSVASGQYFNPISTLTDADIKRKFEGAADMQQLKDSLKSMVGTSSDITDNFTISLPTRLVFNLDKNIGRNLYVNADLSINFYSTATSTKLHTRELNLLTITPRWETIGLGAYLPVQYNTQGQLWVGGAVKLGPLVVGVHDLRLLFKKDISFNGGGYLMLSIHPFNTRRVLSKMDCPEY